MNPTVSERMASRPEGSMTRRSVGSSVAKSLRGGWRGPCAYDKHHAPCWVQSGEHPAGWMTRDVCSLISIMHPTTSTLVSVCWHCEAC